MTSMVVVVDYGSGNLRSAAKALEYAAQKADLDVRVVVSAETSIVKQADRIVLPGVGAFGDCRSGLDAIPDMMDVLNEVVLVHKRPFLGICVGMQLLAEKGLEHGTHQGFGWFEGTVKALEPNDKSLKIPHMGWNRLHFTKRGADHPLLHKVVEGQHVYFVHSFALDGDEKDVLAHSDYGGPVTAMIARDNIAGVQFHPEKSQAVGLQLLTNFLRWKP